jgi:4-hydroxy-3-methylbut-2-en-1-yl diphosphate synthase IspG/GcpE
MNAPTASTSRFRITLDVDAIEQIVELTFAECDARRIGVRRLRDAKRCAI